MNTFAQPQAISIEVTDGALEALRKTHGWIRFLGIVSIVFAFFAGLVFLIGAMVSAFGSLMGLMMMIEGIVLLVVTVCYAIYWMGYANTLRRLLGDEAVTGEVLDEAMIRQRRLWILQGVMTIIFIALAIAMAVAAPLLALHS